MRNPLRCIAVRCAPRARKVTAWPASASDAPSGAPIPPAPITAMRMAFPPSGWSMFAAGVGHARKQATCRLCSDQPDPTGVWRLVLSAAISLVQPRGVLLGPFGPGFTAVAQRTGEVWLALLVE